MPGAIDQAKPNTVTPRSVFIVRFITTIVLWSVALVIAFSGYELAFYALICVFGLIALWELAMSAAVARRTDAEIHRTNVLIRST